VRVAHTLAILLFCGGEPVVLALILQFG